MERKSLCAVINMELHKKITEEKEYRQLTLSEYMEQLLTEYYEMKGKVTMTESIRTLAIQIPSELMDRLDTYLQERGLKKKVFLRKLIEDALDDELSVTDNVELNETSADKGSTDEIDEVEGTQATLLFNYATP